MSLLLKAFPHGRPRPRAPRALLVLSLTLSMALLALPMGEVAQAQTPAQNKHHAARHTAHAKAAKKKPAHAKKAKAKARKKVKPPRVPGQPPHNYVMRPGSYFSFPNRGKSARLAIRNRILNTVQSVWGGPRDALGAPLPTNGTIRMVTWTFDDWRLAHALVAAKKRGVTVQVLAAKKANRGHSSWTWLRAHLGQQLSRPAQPRTALRWSFARACRGSCRGKYGTSHAKYMLFTNVGAVHQRKVTMQTSANLTWFAFQGQWNQAQVSYAGKIYDDFYSVFWQARLDRPVAVPYRSALIGNIRDYFFPLGPISQAVDPVDQMLRKVQCSGAVAGGTGHTIVRVNQYAIYGARGEWLARRLRQLWEGGCSVAIIYTVASRPVIAILRSGTGRGAVPMRQSVITNSYGTIVKYNHSKSVTIVGRYGTNAAAYLTFSGSANWADLALGSDEQMQRVDDRGTALAFLRNFATTWGQPSSHLPGYGVLPNITGRVIPTFAPDVPADEPEWGKGVFKYMTPD